VVWQNIILAFRVIALRYEFRMVGQAVSDPSGPLDQNFG